MTKVSDLKILIVDDMTTIRNVFKKIFAKLGMDSLTEADSTDSAWCALEEAVDKGIPYDVVLCDWNMPGGNGIDLLEKIRASSDDRIRLTKFIMVTGAHDKTIQSMDAGANNVVHKPFTAEVICNKFELLFGVLDISLNADSAKSA